MHRASLQLVIQQKQMKHACSRVTQMWCPWSKCQNEGKAWVLTLLAWDIISEYCTYKRANFTYKCSTVSPGNPFRLGSKGQSQNVCVMPVFRQCSIIAAAYVSNAGFSLCHIPKSACHWVFPGVVFWTLVSDGFF